METHLYLQISQTQIQHGIILREIIIFCSTILRLFGSSFQSLSCFWDDRILAAPVNTVPAPPFAFSATVRNLFGIPYVFAVWPFAAATVDSFGDLFNGHVFISLR
jgi:hypothetical protein